MKLWLGTLGVDVSVSVEELVGHTLAKSLEAPHASAILRKLLGSETYQLMEEKISPGQSGKLLSEIRSNSEDLVLGAKTKTGIEIGVDTDFTLSLEDSIIVVRKVKKYLRNDITN
ncbi:hypothetical protein SAMN02745225_01537 [Ferrithrix thermotolerans DSM 19514]|uniref:Uncharacterized protein n=1 Tax=Ferrithrix thermotolerans DSM 19514 TaxID=1121881 RepID=A0A1M4W3E5_9ACTN|nr:hypothetical protein [Ferrithrix thermotolerans]SHE75729.1 hypothetical protein SAMN02745225_01537 [Ferrithrix thermotolerans DSM 19514]